MWQEVNDTLFKRFDFKDFSQALAFVNLIGKLAETQNHHPDIKFGWGYVEISLITHSEGGITNRDRKLADAIDQLPTD